MADSFMFPKPKKTFKLKKGALHEDLGVPQGQKIPAKKLQQALKSKNPTLRKRAQFAENAKSFNHSKKSSY
jgi:hypothetical protein